MSDEFTPTRVVPIKRALLSVFYKDGIVDFAKTLEDAQIEIIASGGTAIELRGRGIQVTDTLAYTGQPARFGHRVATLNERIHGGILYQRDKPADVEEASVNNIPPIDLVVVNLYPVQEAIATGNLDLIIEKTDIGGPTLLRGAAKNWRHVAAVGDPQAYEIVADSIRRRGGLNDFERLSLARDVFQRTAAYDKAIEEALSEPVSTMLAQITATHHILGDN